MCDSIDLNWQNLSLRYSTGLNLYHNAIDFYSQLLNIIPFDRFRNGAHDLEVKIVYHLENKERARIVNTGQHSML
jgi:hypothetical protein